MNKTTQTYTSNCLRPAFKRKSLKQLKKKNTHYLQSNEDNDDHQFLTRDKVSQKTVEYLHYLKSNERKKKMANL